jgi:tetratricopeptide (TPR) repeat protein
LLLLSLLAAGPAQADVAKARAHYERGRSYFQVGEYRKALEEFKAAHVEKNDPAYIYNIAECHRQLREPQDAVFFYRRFLRLVPPSSPLRTEAERRIAELEPQAPAATSASATDLHPGSGPPGSAATPPSSPNPHGEDRAGGGGARSRRVAGYVVGGAGLLALAIGAYFGVDAWTTWKESESLCPADMCNDRGRALSEEAGTSARIADIAVGTGLVGIGLATYLILTSRAGAPSAPSAAWRVRVRPEIAAAGGAGLALGTSW